MARISVKYPCGTKVQSALPGGPAGVITAVFIRGKNRAYELSYIDSGHNPTSVTVEEPELVSFNRAPPKVGFC